MNTRTQSQMLALSTHSDGTGADVIPQHAPHSAEAEQQLLGALLTRNELYSSISDTLNDAHFYDPVHARIFELISTRIGKGALASPVTLKPFLENDEGLKELGGPAYLVRLAGAAVSTFAANDYAKMIRDMAIRRELITIGQDISEKAYHISEGLAPDEQITDAEATLYRLAEKDTRSTGFAHLAKATKIAVETANDAHKNPGGLVGFSTGMRDLDKKLGGLQRSDLIIVAGRPSMGKTALATNIGYNIARKRAETAASGMEAGAASQADKGGIVGFFSLEMSSEQLATRILAGASKIDSDKIRRGQLNQDELYAFIRSAGELETCPLYIDDTPALTIDQLRSRARRLQRSDGLDVMIVDYLQLVHPDRIAENRVIEVSKITQGLKALAKELDVPVIALSQLSREVDKRDNKKPVLSDLRDSGSIEQDADVVMFVYREEWYRSNQEPKEAGAKHDEWRADMEKLYNKATVIIGKHRNGPTGEVELHFDKQHTHFSDPAHPSQEQAHQGDF